jgi:hypothetical protein
MRRNDTRPVSAAEQLHEPERGATIAGLMALVRERQQKQDLITSRLACVSITT